MLKVNDKDTKNDAEFVLCLIVYFVQIQFNSV